MAIDDYDRAEMREEAKRERQLWTVVFSRLDSPPDWMSASKPEPENVCRICRTEILEDDTYCEDCKPTEECAECGEWKGEGGDPSMFVGGKDHGCESCRAWLKAARKEAGR